MSWLPDVEGGLKTADMHFPGPPPLMSRGCGTPFFVRNGPHFTLQKERL